MSKLQIVFKSTTLKHKEHMAVKNKILFTFIVFTTIGIVKANPALAINLSQGIAIDIEVENNSVPEGSIISLTDGKYRLSTIPYDGSVFGVVTDHPAVAFKDLASKNKRSVITLGKTLLRVSTINGLIKAGDLITTSSIPGVGQKATENGYIVGIAGEDYTQPNPRIIGTIYSTMHLNYGMVSATVRENLIASLLQGARAPFSSPLNTLRYILAGFVAFLSFGGGFWFFGRASSMGVEAVGRNPLARRYILLSVLLNVLITIAVMGFGVALAYIILVI